MNADPFLRGPWPVGVETRAMGQLTVEHWYPADRKHQGDDLAATHQDHFEDGESMFGPGERQQAAVRGAVPEAMPAPLVLFSHGYAGNRREFTTLCSHLASHGFRLLSADHGASTFDEVQDVRAAETFDRAAHMETLARGRMDDLAALIAAADMRFGKAERFAICGTSLGGFTALMAPTVDERIVGIVAMAAAGGRSPLTEGIPSLRDHFRSDPLRAVPILSIVADGDAWVPLPGQIELVAEMPGRDRLVAVLADADHQHFVDDAARAHEWLRGWTAELETIDDDLARPPWAAMAAAMKPFDRLTSEATGHRAICGLATWHLRRTLMGAVEAPQALASRLADHRLPVTLLAPIGAEPC